MGRKSKVVNMLQLPISNNGGFINEVCISARWINLHIAACACSEGEKEFWEICTRQLHNLMMHCLITHLYLLSCRGHTSTHHNTVIKLSIAHRNVHNWPFRPTCHLSHCKTWQFSPSSRLLYDSLKLWFYLISKHRQFQAATFMWPPSDKAKTIH